MESTVCSHPERKKVDELILAGISVRKVAASVTPPINPQALHRYKHSFLIPAISSKSNPPAKVEEAIQAKAGALLWAQKRVEGSPVRERLQELWDRTRRSLDTIEDTATGPEDIARQAPLLGQAHKNVELLAQLTGELSSAAAGPSTAIQIVIAGPLDSQVRSEPASQSTDDSAITIDIGADIG